jgi:hypothetical protein
MRPHPQGLTGRVTDALDDLESLLTDRRRDDDALAAIRWAKTKAVALVGALDAEDHAAAEPHARRLCNLSAAQFVRAADTATTAPA